jgi:hypothetical protein
MGSRAANEAAVAGDREHDEQLARPEIGDVCEVRAQAASLVTLGADLLADAGICDVVKSPLASAELASSLLRWLSA